jgi:hypothetical protein
MKLTVAPETVQIAALDGSTLSPTGNPEDAAADAV